MSGVSNTAPRFDDLLEGRIRLSCTHSLELLQLRDMKQNQQREKVQWGKAQRKPGESFQESFPHGVNWLCLIFPVSHYDNICKMLSTKQAH